MPLRDIRHLIGASSELEAVRKNAQRQTVLQRAYQDYCDSSTTGLAYLTNASRVGYIKAGTLYLLADQAAVAAKLRQILPRLLPILSKLDAEVTGIKVVLQANFPRQQHTNQVRKKSLPVDSIQQFENLSQTVHDPALKSALARLVRNHSKTKD